MLDALTDQLRAQLGSIEAAISPLANRRRLIEELLSLESADVAASRPSARRTRRAEFGQSRLPRRRSLPRPRGSARPRGPTADYRPDALQAKPSRAHPTPTGPRLAQYQQLRDVAALATEQTAQGSRLSGHRADPLQVDVVLVVTPAPQSARGLARQQLRLGACEFGAGPRLLGISRVTVSSYARANGVPERRNGPEPSLPEPINTDGVTAPLG